MVILISSQFHNIVEALIFGHTHADMFGLLERPGTEGDYPTKAVLACPGVTPYDHTNPAFRIFHYAKDTFKLLDFENFYLDLHYLQTVNKTWTAKSLGHRWEREYRFTTSYHVANLSDSNLVQVYNRLQQDPILLKQYIHLYYNLAANPVLPARRFVCAIHNQSEICDTNK